jgi:hypothetical protein
MAVTAPAADVSSGRKLTIGANVTLAVIVAAALLVTINWFSSLKHVRKDVAAGGNYGLSDRTRSILDGNKGAVEFSMLYPNDEQDDKQQGYISRLMDYFDEMQRFAPGVKVTHVTSPMQQEKLVSALSEKFGGEAGTHKQALADFEKLRSELQTEIGQKLAEASALMENRTWLSDFPIFASIRETMRVDTESLKKAADEIKEFTPAGGIPKYKEATAKAKSTLTEVKSHLEAIDKKLRELANLSKEVTDPQSKNMAMLKKVMTDVKTLFKPLRDAVGRDRDPMPADPSGALKTFADQSQKVGNELEALARKVDGFARQYPAVTQHQSWGADVKMGMLTARMEISDVLQQASQTLSKARLVILGVIDTAEPAKLKEALVGSRRNVDVLEQNAEACNKLLGDLVQGLGSLDEGSRKMLEAAGKGSLFADRIAAINALDKQIAALPELKLGSIADNLKQKNSIVVQANNKVRVVSFGDAFPVRESIGGPSAKGEESARSFNGDAALSSALLALTRDKPFATVVLTSYEPPAPQQRNQFTPPPPRSWIPSNALTELRKRLEAGNFKVVDWNMATTPEPPKAEEGTECIYICMPPPPPAPPSPFGAQQDEKKFGDAERNKIKNLLADNAKVVFLATWELASAGMFGGPPTTPPYGYGQLLASDWGIKVENSRRITWVEPDRNVASGFQVSLRRFTHMPVGGFTSHAIGKPLLGTRFLVNDCCILDLSDKLPEGVSATTILAIPRKENYIAPQVNDLMQIIDRLRDRESHGTVVLDPMPPSGPFDIMIAAERKKDGKDQGRIVVMSFGDSIRDDYLTQEVLAEGETIRFEPPATEAADLLTNSLYWLQGEPQWISRGPLPVPRIRPIATAEQRGLRWLVWGIWPLVILVPGVALWFVRRR